MPSINLLPENFTIEAYKKRERIAVYVLGALIMLASTALCAWAETGRRGQEKEAAVLAGEVEKVEKDIKYNVESSNLLSSDYSKDDVSALLKDHVYYSKVMTFLKTIIVKDAYIESVAISVKDESSLEASLVVVARDNDTMAKQISVLKDSFWITSVAIDGVSEGKDGGTGVDAIITIRKEIVAYHEQFWDFGVETLASECNRYVEVKSYAVTTKTETDKATGEKKESVVVSFNGISYDSTKLDEFEKRMNQKNDIVKELKITRSATATDKPGVINFKGTLILKH